MEIYFQLVNDAESLRKACDELKGEPYLGFDVETTELDPYRGELRLVQLSDGRNTKVVDLRGFGAGGDSMESVQALRKNPELKPLRDLLASNKQTKIAHNAKFDTKWVRHHLGTEVGGVYDTYLASLLIAAGEGDRRHGLADVVQFFLGRTLDKTEQVSDWGANELSHSQIEYAARDAADGAQTAILTIVVTPQGPGILTSNGRDVEVDPDRRYGDSNPGNNYAQTVQTIVTPRVADPFDYDADGRSDISVFRPGTGGWYLQRSTAGFYGENFGSADDRIAPADYDGDGKTDIAVYRPSTGVWYVSNSSTGTFSYHGFGTAEDLPIPADYDGDGKADISVFRPSTGSWYRQNSSDGSFFATQFGTLGDKPTVGDFDGDGKADVAVFRPSTGAWYQAFSSNGTFFGEQFGISTDKITPADYDGDGKTDIAIYRPAEGLWYVKNSSTSTYTPYLFGLAEDIPVPSDFDGDGKADIGVFRPSNGTWYIANSSNGSYTIFQWGQNGDHPTQSAFGN